LDVPKGKSRASSSNKNSNKDLAAKEEKDSQIDQVEKPEEH
jgi:hypothetical protein